MDEPISAPPVPAVPVPAHLSAATPIDQDPLVGHRHVSDAIEPLHPPILPAVHRSSAPRPITAGEMATALASNGDSPIHDALALEMGFRVVGTAFTTVQPSTPRRRCDITTA